MTKPTERCVDLLATDRGSCTRSLLRQPLTVLPYIALGIGERKCVQVPMFPTAFEFSMNTVKCSHEIHYQSLFDAGRSLCFPCDINGHVPLDALSERGLANYLYARAVVGKEFAFPLVTPSAHH